MNKNKWVKIGVLLLVVLLVGGVWLIKDQKKVELQTAGIQNQTGGLAEGQDPNFVLYTTKMDVAALSAYKLPMILDFGADDCIPCQEMAPALNAIHEEMQGKAIIKYADVWKHTEAAEGFPIQVVPTQVMYSADGTPYVPSDAVAASIKLSMYNAKDTDEHLFTIHQGGLTQEQMRLILADMGVVL